MLLAGDVGGTKTVLGLFSEDQGPHDPLIERRYESSEYDSLEQIVVEFVSTVDVNPTTATFGVAGPVHGGRVQVTNLPWRVDIQDLTLALNGAPVYLLNDLEAVASAVPALNADDLQTVKSGQTEAEGPIAVIAPGTGLGEAFLFWDGDRYRPVPSEGGHTDFAPATPLELELLAYLQPRLGHVSYERVCSGTGIPNLYAFLRDMEKHPEPPWLRRQLASTEDPTPLIVALAQDNGPAICQAALELFLGILGSEAGNLVLQILATGGVYLGGGIPPRILQQLRGKTFIEAFTRKGRFSPLLERVHVQVIVNPKSGLYGAANHGLLKAAGQRRRVGGIASAA